MSAASDIRVELKWHCIDLAFMASVTDPGNYGREVTAMIANANTAMLGLVPAQ